MGKLADDAKRRDPKLMVEPNETVIVAYKSYRLVPSKFDRTKDVFEFTFSTDFGDKFIETSSNALAMILDSVGEGNKVSITKVPKTQQDGTVKHFWEIKPHVEDKIVDEEPKAKVK